MKRKSFILCLMLFACTLVASAEKWKLQWPTYSNELKKQATLDNERAYVDLAICYGYGLGVKQDVKKCEKMFTDMGLDFKAYHAEDCALIWPYASFWYGVFLCDHANEYTAKQLKWIEWSDRAQKKIPADSETIRWRGLRYIFAVAENGMLFDAMMFAARTERNNHDESHYNRDTMRGKGWNENVPYASNFGYYKESMKFYQKACEEGNVDAMLEFAHYLIDMVEMSKGRFEDNQDELAVYWTKTAAEMGSPEAQWIYGNLYRVGWRSRVTRDMDKAIEWYKKSADNSYAPAMGFAGKYILTSSAPDKETLALKYLQMGVENKDGGAACELGKYYKNTNPELALQNFQLAGQMNHPEGLYELGNALYNGLGTTPDLKAAAQAYETCANLDLNNKFVGLCALKIADMYENGTGVFMNKDKAASYRGIAEWYNLK